VLGDQHDHDPAVDAACTRAGQIVVATRRGPYPHTEDGVDVRRLLRELRSRAMENLNEQFTGIFEAHGQVALWDRQEHGLDLRVGLKPFLKAA
jgi:hypothetical protein